MEIKTDRGPSSTQLRSPSSRKKIVPSSSVRGSTSSLSSGKKSPSVRGSSRDVQSNNNNRQGSQVYSDERKSSKNRMSSIKEKKPSMKKVKGSDRRKSHLSVEGIASKYQSVANEGSDCSLLRGRSFFDKFLENRRPNSQGLTATEQIQFSKKDLKVLEDKFSKFDEKCKGYLQVVSFARLLDVERTAFTDAVFAFADSDGSGTMDFTEFTEVLANYCMFSQLEILQFAYHYFDADGSGILDEAEVMAMTVAINPHPSFPGNIKQLFKTFDANGDGVIDFNEFCAIHTKYPMLLFPAFQLQDVLQHKTLGRARWTKLLNKFHERTRIAEYQKTHGGALPPKIKTCGCF